MGIIQDRIKLLRAGSGMTQEDLAKKLRVSKGAIGNYETGRRVPDMETLNAIADIFNVDMDYLTGRTTETPEYTLEEQWIIDCYRKVDEDMRVAVKTILRKFGEAPAVKPAAKVVPLFPAAAGPGEPIEGNAIDKCEAPADSAADFAVRISGDSMEPQFKDGEIVLCRQKKAEAGDIAVIMVNGLLLVKQFVPGYGGQWYLRSLNRDRADLDYDHLPSNNDTVTGFGVVIHKRIPMVTP